MKVNIKKDVVRRCMQSAGLLLTATAIAACSGGSSVTSPTSSNTDTNTNTNTNTNSGSNPILFDPKLSTVPADTVIRTAMLDYYTNPQANSININAQVDVLESTADSSVADSADSGAQTRFSDTNVQETGVDESDRVKLDGSLMFALERPSSLYNGIVEVPTVEPVGPNGTIEPAGPDGTTEPVGPNGTTEPVGPDGTTEPVGPNSVADLADQPLTIFSSPETTLTAYQLDKENSQLVSRLKLEDLPSGMYLHKNQGQRDLVMLSSGSFDWGYWNFSSRFANGTTQVSWIDATDANDLNLVRTLSVDGQMISSRKIGNQLILVTRYHPYIEGIVEPYNEGVIATNRSLIESTDHATLLPRYTVEFGDSVVTGDVISDNQCYKNTQGINGTNTGADSEDPYFENPSVISIITINLNDPTAPMQNTCFIGQSETIYVSKNSLYLATTQYQYSETVDSEDRPLVSNYPPEITTEIHKFRFRDGQAPAFRGSASVDGHLGWFTARKPFRMSEKDDRLRIVTFDENRSGSPVTLNILEESDGEILNTISTLPNDNRPEPIGKPNENLYASRFIGDRAYLVTFRITDPLYVLDLSDPYDPYIAGELELPGYSDYLHPVSDDLLLGIGKDAIAADGNGWGDGRGAFYQGVKLALFDVSDPTAPAIADTRVFGKRGTDTPALYQHHAFAYLPEGDGRNARMAIPMSLHDEQPPSSGPSVWADWTSNNMLKMEIDVLNATFVDVPDWIFESRDAGHIYSPVGLENDRAVIGSDGGLYVIHNGALQYGLWNDAAPLSATE